MDPRSRPVQLHVPLPAADHRIYLAAVRRLRRVMGRKAPDLPRLIQYNLQGRDATGLADDYLDSVGWPVARRRRNALQRTGRSPVRGPRTLPRAQRANRELTGRAQPPVDPSRN